MAHLFFSYARKDRERLEPFCNRLEYELERCLWIDRKDIPDKALWMQEIEKGIQTSDGVIFAVTANFVDPEREVIHKREIPWAYQHFKDRNNVNLYPILFDDVELPELLKTPHITHLIDARDGDMKRVYAEFKKVVRSESPGSRPFLVAWPRLSNFKGRDQQLIELHQKLMGDGRVGVKTTGLHGMGGIGKTQLAVEYAYRYQSCYPSGVYWLNAGADWRKEVVAVADRLGLTPIDTSDTDRDKQMVLAFQKYLAGQDKDALLVLDNVDDPAHVIRREIAPKLTIADLCSQTRTRLLLTTRVQTLPLGFESVSVNVLSPEDARAILLDAWVASERDDKPDRTGLDAIAQALGYLPLALGWIEAALRQLPETSPSQLLDELRKRGLDDLIHELRTGNIDLGTPEYHDRLVGSVLDWQLGQLKSGDSPRLLALTAAFGEVAVVPLERLRLLMGLPEKGLVKPFPKAVKDLQAYSLVETLSEGSAFRLHPLTQIYAATKLDSGNHLTEAVPRLVTSYRDPAMLDAQTQTRGFAAVMEDLTATQRLLTDVYKDLGALSRLLTLEEPHLLVLPDGNQVGYVIQQICERAYHEGDTALYDAYDNWLRDKTHIYHRGLPYPTSKALLRTLNLHASFIDGAIQLKNGCILSWAYENTLQLWSDQGKPLTTLQGHSEIVNGALQLTDGRILSWSDDHSLRLWSDQGKPLATLQGHSNGVMGALQLTDGRILSWSSDSTLQLWSDQGKPLTTLQGHSGGALQLMDGRILSWAGDLQLWSDQGKLLASLQGHSNGVMGALQLTDGRILSWACDHTLRLWSDQGEFLMSLQGHSETVNGALQLIDGHILSWADDLRLWSDQGEFLMSLQGHSNGIIGALQLTDGRILSWEGDRTLRLWSDQGEPLASLQGHSKGIIGALQLTDGRILSWSSDRTLRLWSDQGEPLASLQGHSSIVDGALQLSSGHILSWSHDTTLRLWSDQDESLASLQGHSNSVIGVLQLTSGHILSWSDDHTLRLWSDQGKPLTTLQGHSNSVIGALQLTDGRILSWSYDYTLRLWSDQGKPLTTLQGHSNSVIEALQLTDGRILSWAWDSTFRLYSDQGKFLKSFKGHPNRVSRAIQLADGRILSWSFDHTLRLWSDQGEPLASLQGHSETVNGALQLTDGRILSWSSDHSLRLWSNQGKYLMSFKGHSKSVKGALQLTDGRILSWSDDHTLRLWSDQGKCFMSLKGHSETVNGALQLTDGRILSWSDDHSLRLWSNQGKYLVSIRGHSSAVRGALELPDGCILSWSFDWNLRIITKEAKPLAIFSTDSTIACCVITKDGQIVIGEEGGRVLFLKLIA